MILKPAPVSTRQFTYDPATATFSAEMSETKGFGRVYDDSADEGLTLVSSRTGQAIVFAVYEDHRDSEGELTHWTLRPVNSEPYAMTIWND